MNRRSLRRTALMLVAMCVLLPLPVHAGDDEVPSLMSEGGAGAGAALASLVYVPLKLAYAAGGLVIAGLAWAWTAGDTNVSGPIYRSSVGGDYVITPSQVSREEPVSFAGG